jgi:hypothetical protein
MRLACIGTVVESGKIEFLGITELPERGTPQGGVISPLLCNVAQMAWREE